MASRNPAVPGAPGSETPAADEPTAPRDPLPPKPEQGTPETRTPTGARTGAPPTADGQQGAQLTTAQGTPLRDTDHSLKAGPRGPLLMQDHHFREKITHFDTFWDFVSLHTEAQHHTIWNTYPEWELGVQVFPDTPEETFAGIDLLDPTKIVPEERFPASIA